MNGKKYRSRVSRVYANRSTKFKLGRDRFANKSVGTLREQAPHGRVVSGKVTSKRCFVLSRVGRYFRMLTASTDAPPQQQVIVVVKFGQRPFNGPAVVFGIVPHVGYHPLQR